MATSTPWGRSQYSEKIAVGIMSYSTAGHGGIHLSKKRNAMVPEYMRNINGWYEEDCEWAIPAIVFPVEFNTYRAGIETKALDTFRNWFPNQYEMYMCKKLKEGESYIRDQEIHKERNKNNYIVISATIHKSGKVLGTATIGGVRDFSNAKDFLISSKEYGTRSNHGFVINPKIHQEVC